MRRGQGLFNNLRVDRDNRRLNFARGRIRKAEGHSAKMSGPGRDCDFRLLWSPNQDTAARDSKQLRGNMRGFASQLVAGRRRTQRNQRNRRPKRFAPHCPPKFYIVMRAHGRARVCEHPPKKRKTCADDDKNKNYEEQLETREIPREIDF